MRKANTEIIPLIKQKALELLMQKNPEEIGMREIASDCSVTATTLYHYYKDKEELFQAVALDCLRELNQRILSDSKKGKTLKVQIKNAVTAYSDWCFENPRRAMLVMQGIKSAETESPEVIEEFYICNRTGEELLKKAVTEGSAVSKNPRLDVALLVFGLWGCIESVFLKKSETCYWKDGKPFTDAFINLWLESVFKK